MMFLDFNSAAAAGCGKELIAKSGAIAAVVFRKSRLSFVNTSNEKKLLLSVAYLQ
jgi:hypothetical protein